MPLKGVLCLFALNSRSLFHKPYAPMSKFEERYSQLTGLIEDAEEDLMKFYEKENKAAGTRARKSMMELKKLAHEIRQEIQTIKNEEL